MMRVGETIKNNDVICELNHDKTADEMKWVGHWFRSHDDATAAVAAAAAAAVICGL